MIVLLLIMGGVYFYIFTEQSGGRVMNTNYVVIFFAVFGGMMLFSSYRGLKKQKLFLENYKLTIEDNVITREQPNTEELTIYFHEVKEIYRNKQGGFSIRGFDKTDIINIPEQIENYMELETLLDQIKPITTESVVTPRLQKLKPLVSLLGFVSMIITYAASNKILVGICGTLATISICWNIYETRISKNVDKRAKSMVWLSAVVVLVIIFTMITKLRAN